MSKAATKIATKTETRVERPRLHKVILFNDDYTPREFVVEVLKGVFRLNETQALNVMMTAHRKGVCVVAVFAQDIAETKAARGTEATTAEARPSASVQISGPRRMSAKRPVSLSPMMTFSSHPSQRRRTTSTNSSNVSWRSPL